MAIFQGEPYNLERIKNFDLIFWYMYNVSTHDPQHLCQV